jgi:hypothetical protein
MSDPAMNKCSCHECGKHLKYPAEYEGTEIACPHCGKPTPLEQSQIKAIEPIPNTPAPPPMGGPGAPAPPPMSSPGRATATPSARGQATPDAKDPLAGAVPQDLLQSAQAAESNEPDPFTCEFCGADMEPEEKVCIECGERRPTIRNWNGTLIFRVAAGIVLALGLLILALQWTTTSKPFGLRQHSRHAVLVTLGLREEVDPAAATTNAPSATGTVAKDPDLVLQSHAMKPDQDNGVLYIRGTVKNISQYRYLGVKVKFNLKDASGSVIPGATISAYVQTIEAGKEWNFKALVLDPDAISYEPLLPVEGYR